MNELPAMRQDGLVRGHGDMGRGGIDALKNHFFHRYSLGSARADKGMKKPWHRVLLSLDTTHHCIWKMSQFP